MKVSPGWIWFVCTHSQLSRELTIAGNDSGSKQSHVLEPVLLRALSPDDAPLCSSVERLDGVERGCKGARGALVKAAFAAELGGVEVGGQGQNPGSGNGVE